MRTVKVVLIALLLSGCAHKAPPPPTPLFDAFQKYCVATEGRWEAVDRAATADGFRRNGEPVFSPFPIDSTSWQLHKNVVSIGPLHNRKLLADGRAELVAFEPPGTRAEFCNVHIIAERDDSQAAFAIWAGVPIANPSIAQRVSDDLNDKYRFRIEGGKHLLADPDPVAAVKAGGYWHMTFYKRGTEYGVLFSHYYLAGNGG